MTMNQLIGMLTRDELYDFCKQAKDQKINIPEGYDGNEMKRVSLHINDDDTSYLSFSKEHFKIGEVE